MCVYVVIAGHIAHALHHLAAAVSLPLKGVYWPGVGMVCCQQEVTQLFRGMPMLKRLDTRENPYNAQAKSWEKVVMMSPSSLGTKLLRGSLQ